MPVVILSPTDIHHSSQKIIKTDPLDKNGSFKAECSYKIDILVYRIFLIISFYNIGCQ